MIPRAGANGKENNAGGGEHIKNIEQLGSVCPKNKYAKEKQKINRGVIKIKRQKIIKLTRGTGKQSLNATATIEAKIKNENYIAV